MQWQWKERQSHWREITWQRQMSDRQLERHANELLGKRQRLADKQSWDQVEGCSNALFLVRDEQRRRRSTS
jgi:hypothetical protein